MRSRQHRLQNFRKRAEAFAVGSERGEPFVRLLRDGRRITVGAGKHRRLMLKRDLAATLEVQRQLLSFMRRHRPTRFVLVPVKGKVIGSGFYRTQVQEYFHRPSIRNLRGYFEYFRTRKKNTAGLSEEDYMMAKRLVREFPGVTEAALTEAVEEMTKAFYDGACMPLIDHNVLVLGQNRDGRLRIAFVDV